MCTDEIETRYCQYVDDVLNHHRIDHLADYLAADVVSHARGIATGVAGAHQLVAWLVDAFPDFHVTIETLAAVDGQLLARLTARGTHTGNFFGVAATGRQFRVGAFGAWRFRNGRCAEQWLQLDVLELCEQLGITRRD
jgi:predicted ester cyclase